MKSWFCNIAFCVLTLWNICHAEIFINETSSRQPYKRRYISASGMHKIKRYLQKKYNNEHVTEPLLRRSFYTNTWAVNVDPPTKFVADRIAKKHGFVNIGKIGNIPGHFHFKHDDISTKKQKRDVTKTDLLQLEEEVKNAVQQRILDRYKRDEQIFFNDPMFKDMWYLINTGQTDGPPGVDLNVLSVWKEGITGKGIVISVLDDGIDHTHPDLIMNYDPNASNDLNDNDDDPRPRDSDPDNCHGTRCAGEAAAVANNSICGLGVAFNAKIGGIRMLDGQATDALEASALGYKSEHIDIYINCWGPKDDGKTFGKPGPMAAKALRQGAEEGRGGRGSIFIWATGNGGLTDDDCNCDGYTTSIFTISIGCIGNRGLSAYYTEKCSSTLAVTFNGASHREGAENKVVTTDLYHKCTEEFKGTSASAPLAAGVVALVLERNPSLTWRDIQELIVQTALKTSPLDTGWKTNGASFHFNHKFGFGRLDALAMVNKAAEWLDTGFTLKPQRKCTAASSFDRIDIPNRDFRKIPANTIACENTIAHINRVEHVVLTVSFVHRRRGDVSIDLISPKGTTSEMLSTRKYDDSDEGLDEWNFMTVYNWGEDPRGQWMIVIRDNPDQDDGLFSRDNDDLESLEDRVIDSQMKMQQNNLFDGAFQPMRKDTIMRNAYETSQQQTNNFNDDRSFIPENEDMTYDNVITNSDDYGGNYEYVDGDGANKELYKRKKRDILDDARNEIFEYYSKISKKKGSVVSTQNTDNKYKKVQVQTEETGVPRVQVNAGYENPKIQCEGSEACSGVLLKWVLTLYGSGDMPIGMF